MTWYQGQSFLAEVGSLFKVYCVDHHGTRSTSQNHSSNGGGGGEQVNSPCSKPGSMASTVGKKIQQFPKHDTIKVGENNFLLMEASNHVGS